MQMIDFVNIVKKSRFFAEVTGFHIEAFTGHHKLCVITGPNMSGKSLLRKILTLHHQDKKIHMMYLSQQGRCAGGIERVFMYGDEGEESTGYNSVGTLLGAIRTGQKQEKPFSLLLDEPEIGCSEELAAALGIRLARDLETMPQLVGCFVISHSRQFVKQLLPFEPTEIRLSKDGLRLKQWVKRKVKPVESLEDLRKEGLQRWRQIEKIIAD